jgi:hypothetical protein
VVHSNYLTAKKFHPSKTFPYQHFPGKLPAEVPQQMHFVQPTAKYAPACPEHGHRQSAFIGDVPPRPAEREHQDTERKKTQQQHPTGVTDRLQNQ